MRDAVSVPAGLLALALLGCAACHHSVGFRVAAGDHAAVLVLGTEPVVQVSNRGPGVVDVVFETPDGNRQESLRLDTGTVERKLRGPFRVSVHGKGKASADIRLVAEQSAGLRVDGPFGVLDPASETEAE
jgi:hypothetical protein